MESNGGLARRGYKRALNPKRYGRAANEELRKPTPQCNNMSLCINYLNEIQRGTLIVQKELTRIIPSRLENPICILGGCGWHNVVYMAAGHGATCIGNSSNPGGSIPIIISVLLVSLLP